MDLSPIHLELTNRKICLTNLARMMMIILLSQQILSLVSSDGNVSHLSSDLGQLIS